MLNKGEMLGDVTIVRTIGENGYFSYLFEGTHPSHAESIAVKVSRPERQDQDDLDRFIHENTILRALHHPERHANIIFPLSEIMTAPHLHFLLELAGSDLQKYITVNQIITLEEKIVFFKKICAGLICAHEHNISHRDLHLENILIKDEGDLKEIKLCDFGRAKDMTHSYPTNALGLDGGKVQIRGPEAYFRPTDLLTMKNFVALDVFSLGLVLFEIIQSSPLGFHGQLEASIVNFLRRKGVTTLNITEQERADLYNQWLDEVSKTNTSSLGLSVSLSIDQKTEQDKINSILKKCCHLDFTQRYTNISDVITDMETI